MKYTIKDLKKWVNSIDEKYDDELVFIEDNSTEWSYDYNFDEIDHWFSTSSVVGKGLHINFHECD